jgi:hypothetical protein
MEEKNNPWMEEKNNPCMEEKNNPCSHSKALHSASKVNMYI